MSTDTNPFRDRLALLVPINNLLPRQQEQVLASAEILEIRKKDYVFRQGDRDHWAYYLLAGELEMYAGDQLIKKVVGGEATSFQPLSQLQPRQMSARATTNVQILRVERRLLDQLLSAGKEQTSALPSIEVAEYETAGTLDWLTLMLQSELFSRIPAANIQGLIDTLETVVTEPGQVVIEQGAAGDYYYAIQHGRCEVCRATSRGREIRLAELGPGDTFGEEALVSNATRNATVRMLTAGVLGRLTKENFIELIRKPVLRSLSLAEARERVAGGARWLDVRFPEEFKANGLAGSLNVPLNLLRTRYQELDATTPYIAYCDTGGRSSAAAFLLAQEGLDVCYVDAGAIDELGKVPPLSGVTPAPAPLEAPLPVVPNPEIEAEVRAQSLGADLARAQLQIEQARRLIEEAEAAKREADRYVAERLASERERVSHDSELLKTKILEATRFKEELERRHREAQAMAAAQRSALEKRAQEFKQQAEQALREKESRMEALYQEQTAKLEQIENERAAARQELDEAWARLQLESTQNQERMLAVKRMEADMAAREQAAAAALQLREEQLRESLRLEMDQERQRLEREFARSAEEIARARQEQIAAEAGKLAAQQEAQRIIAEYQEQQRQQVAEMQQTLALERQSLEQAAATIREQMAAALSAKSDAEASRDEALRQLADAREKHDVKSTTEADLRQEIVALEARAAAATRKLLAAVDAESLAAKAQLENEQRLERAYSSESEVNLLLQKELDEWVAEQERFLNSTAQREELLRQKAQIARINKRATQAQQEAKNRSFSLLDEIASQLGE